ncbi:MAG: DUF4296 domain-containing protein [Bacteroidales bacterium]|nr:DUF4296 domain-containing protein [Bacteroidales bacterium]
MKSPRPYIFVSVLVAVLLSAGCSRKAKLIPRRTLSKIYAEIFMQDQWLLKYPQGRSADTTLIYEPIFEKYGYTSDDYRLSRETYLKDPDRYARILKNSNSILDERAKEIAAEKKALDLIAEKIEGLRKYRPEKIYSLSGLYDPETFVEDSVRFYVDTVGGAWTFNPEKGLDTVYAGPKMVINIPDSVLFVMDSLARVRDSLFLARVDSLAAACARLDSLATAKADSLSRKTTEINQ